MISLFDSENISLNIYRGLMRNNGWKVLCYCCTSIVIQMSDFTVNKSTLTGIMWKDRMSISS